MLTNRIIWLGEMNRPRTFNDAGVVALRNGHLRVAMELFRGALEETQLAIEGSSGAFQQLEPTDTSGPGTCADQFSVTPEYAQRAEYHLSNITIFENQVENVSDLVPEGDPISGYSPFIYRHPFAFPRTVSENLASAIIVFNLALCSHHTRRRPTAEVAKLYSSAARLVLLEGSPAEPTGLLLLGALNNYCVLCFEDGGVGEDYMLSCLGLSRALDGLRIRGSIDPPVETGVRDNIEWLFNHPRGATHAPAA